MKIIAFHTDDPFYTAEADRLRASIDAVGMEHDIQPVTMDGDWYDATAYKAQFCYEMRQKHAGGLLYIDVDAVVHQNCEQYFNGIVDTDVGVHYFQGPKGGHNRTRNDNRLLSGTIWFADTPAVRHMLHAWRHMNQLFATVGIREGGGQKNFWYLLTCLPHIRIRKLPGRYCYVFDKPWAYPEDEPRIIEHLIASRENRGNSKGKTDPSRQHRIAELTEMAQ